MFIACNNTESKSLLLFAYSDGIRFSKINHAEGQENSVPPKISPMLATLVREPFSDPDWVYEVKWDGYRIIGYVQNGKATLYSRGGQDYTSKYKAVANELAGLEDCVIDGEVVVFNPEGRPDLGALQNYHGKGDIAYYVFDLLYFEGESYLNKPLLQRKEILLHVITKENILHYSDHFDDGIAYAKARP